MEENLNINWFPGHMVTARRIITENLKLVDVVAELLDARIPYSSANPILQELIGDKLRVVVLNKADLADDQVTRQWVEHFKARGITAVPVDSLSGKGLKNLLQAIERLTRPLMDRYIAKGIKARSIRAMILGIPNVGKSSLINRLAGSAIAKTADKPGVTRKKQWIKISGKLDLLDTPGVLWPKFDDRSVGLNLAFTGAINDEVYDMEKVAELFAMYIKDNYPATLCERYKIELSPDDKGYDIIEKIGRRRGCIRSGGVVDGEKVAKILLLEFRSGKLGRVSLDKVIQNMTK